MNKTCKCIVCEKTIGDDDFALELPNGLYACGECIDEMHATFHTISNEEMKDDFIPAEFEDFDNSSCAIPTPQELKSSLDTYVIGQDEAKITLAVAVYNHYKRTLYGEKMAEAGVKKSNVIMLGPSGSGKTYLVQTLAKLLCVPFATCDATSLTQVGYVGADAESILSRLLQAAGGDVSLAEHGIIYIDEIDKLARVGSQRSTTRDVGGEGVQQELLKIVEETVVNVPVGTQRPGPAAQTVPVNTADILFICGGAFEGIFEEEKKRNPIGFMSTPEQYEKNDNHNRLLVQHDFIRYGMIPEFIGRFPVITQLNALQKEDLIKILTEPKDSLIGQYKALLDVDGIDLEFEPDAIEAIAERALSYVSGARGLRSILEEVMKNIMYQVPSDKTIRKCTITRAFVENAGEVEYQRVVMEG